LMGMGLSQRENWKAGELGLREQYK